jgi:hypothetical protein
VDASEDARIGLVSKWRLPYWLTYSCIQRSSQESEVALQICITYPIYAWVCGRSCETNFGDRQAVAT